MSPELMLCICMEWECSVTFLLRDVSLWDVTMILENFSASESLLKGNYLVHKYETALRKEKLHG